MGVLANNPMFQEQMQVLVAACASWPCMWLRNRRVGCSRAHAPSPPPPLARQTQYLGKWQAWAEGPPNNQPPLTPSILGTDFWPPPGEPPRMLPYPARAGPVLIATC